jgi:hypothetical protein
MAMVALTLFALATPTLAGRGLKQLASSPLLGLNGITSNLPVNGNTLLANAGSPLGPLDFGPIILGGGPGVTNTGNALITGLLGGSPTPLPSPTTLGGVLGPVTGALTSGLNSITSNLPVNGNTLIKNVGGAVDFGPDILGGGPVVTNTGNLLITGLLGGR